MDIFEATAQIYQQQFTLNLIVIIVVVGIIWEICSWFAGAIDPSPKSRKARTLTTDLYVIGMIRKFAKEDGIDIEQEMKGLRQIEKWEKMSRKSFDSQVEEELKEKISAKQQKEIDKINSDTKK